jgi:superfamily II DNA/RNA helicase
MQVALHEQFTKEGIEHIFIPSTVQTKDRFSKIKRFQEDKNITAIVAGLNVLNRGFTITGANHVIFTDIEFSPESTEQAEGRAHRTGQDKEVTCYYLLIDWEEEKENIDFRMFNLITQKQKAISNAIDGKVRFARTAKVLSAGGDYLAIAKAIQGDDKEPLEFEYEKVSAESEGKPQAPPKIVTVKVEDTGLWDKMYQQLKAEKKEAKPKQKNEDHLTFF